MCRKAEKICTAKMVFPTSKVELIEDGVSFDVALKALKEGRKVSRKSDIRFLEKSGRSRCDFIFIPNGEYPDGINIKSIREWSGNAYTLLDEDWVILK